MSRCPFGILRQFTSNQSDLLPKQVNQMISQVLQQYGNGLAILSPGSYPVTFRAGSLLLVSNHNCEWFGSLRYFQAVQPAASNVAAAGVQSLGRPVANPAHEMSRHILEGRATRVRRGMRPCTLRARVTRPSIMQCRFTRAASGSAPQDQPGAARRSRAPESRRIPFLWRFRGPDRGAQSWNRLRSVWRG